MVLRACNTKFLKIVFDSAEIFDISAHAQHAMKIGSQYAQHAMKLVPCMLSVR
jgi:hypothetical protein